MYRICLIDDKAYGIPQVIRAIPKGIEYEFFYYDRIADIEYTLDYDVVILDYYLDKDGKTALDIIDRLAAYPVIAFSSEDAMNDRILERGAVEKATKLKDTHDNPALAGAIGRILGTKKEG
ncbi:MAG TPA: hypothetical protein PK765_06515 [bacterium]|nr:hypothetical protein [bacterium]